MNTHPTALPAARPSETFFYGDDRLESDFEKK
jgi:hypothetical protein